MFWFNLLCVGVLLTPAFAFDYSGYKIYDVLAENKFQTDMLRQLSENEAYDFFTLTKLLGKPNRVMVGPENQEAFLEALEKYQLEHTVVNSNVGESIEQEKIASARNRALTKEFSLSIYHSHDEINEYINGLARKFSDRVFIKTYGKSYEGRLMQTIRITNGDGEPNKKIIFVDGGFHAREWISPAAVLYLIDQLVENYEENKDLLKDYDWLILPVVNPDGYEFTRSSNRMFRKTRQPNAGSRCVGTDPNRNFDFHWGEKGTSSFPCMENFKGPVPFSEPETQVVRDLLLSLTGRCKMYLTIHSYGNYLLYPWGWTPDLPDTWKDLDEVAQAGGQAIREATGTEYAVGSSTNVLYEAAGASDDYAFGVAHIPISITMELPGGGSSGFDPPESSIDAYVAETWIGIRAMAKKVVQKY